MGRPRLEGKRAMVRAAGIGRAPAHTISAEGATVYACDLDDALAASLWRLQFFGTRAWAHVPDREILETYEVGGSVQRRTCAREDAERAALEHFVAAVRGGTPFPVAIGDVLNGIAAVEDFVDWARRGGVAVALPLGDTACFH